MKNNEQDETKPDLSIIFYKNIKSTFFGHSNFHEWAALSGVNRGFNRQVNIVWEKMFEQHFKYIYQGMVKTSHINWNEEFRVASFREYRLNDLMASNDIAKVRKEVINVFSAAKAGDADRLIASCKQCSRHHYVYENYVMLDSNNISVLDWAMKNIKHEKDLTRVLNAAYQAFIEAGLSKYRDGALCFAIRCHQPLETIEKIFPSDPLLFFLPLHVAVKEGLIDVVTFLITQGANVNAKKLGTGETPLFLACLYGHAEIFKLLIQHHASTALSTQVVAQAKNLPIYEFPINDVTPFEAAIYGGAKEIVNYWLDKNKSSKKDFINEHANALHLAARYGHVDIMELLINYGFDINKASPEIKNRTPLLLAVMYQQDEAIQLLLKHKANIETKEKDSYYPLVNGDTLLHIAIRTNSFPLFKQLSQAGLDVNARNARGETPLFLATVNKRKEMVEYLFDKYQVNPNEAAALKMAPWMFAPDCYAMFISKNDTPFFVAVQSGCIGIIELYLKYKNTNVNAVNWKHLNVLSFVLESAYKKSDEASHRIEIIKMMIKHGVTLNPDPNVSLPPLFAAIGLPHSLNVFQLLLDEGAALNAVNKDGDTPLEVALGYMKELIFEGKDRYHKNLLELENIAKYLIERGASLSKSNAPTKKENKQLSYLKKHGFMMNMHTSQEPQSMLNNDDNKQTPRPLLG